jgi:hypothetical protein
LATCSFPPPPQWFCHKLRIEVYDTQAALFPNLPLTRKSLQARVRAADLPRGLCLPLIRRSLHLCAPLLSNLISELRPLGFKLCKALLVSRPLLVGHFAAALPPADDAKPLPIGRDPARLRKRLRSRGADRGDIAKLPELLRKPQSDQLDNSAR